MVMAFELLPPGIILKYNFMDELKMDSKQFAARLGNVTSNEIDDIIKGASITESMSKKLAKITETHENFWFSVQKNYNKALENKIEEAVIEESGMSDIDITKEIKQQIIIMASFSCARRNRNFYPIPIQKIMYIYDEEVNENAKLFNHEVYKHGPNDHNLTSVLNRMVGEEFLQIKFQDPNNIVWKSRKYSLTDEGFDLGKKLFNNLPVEQQKKLKKWVKWVLQFRNQENLKKEIYKKYPHMDPQNNTSSV